MAPMARAMRACVLVLWWLRECHALLLLPRRRLNARAALSTRKTEPGLGSMEDFHEN